MKNGIVKGAINFVIRLQNVPSWDSFQKGTLPVVLVFNPRFTAAGVAYSEQEYAEFTNLKDGRSRVIFEVPVEKLKKVSDIENYIEEKKNA